MTTFPTILHPTDFSERSHVAFEVACSLARGGARLIVVHVVEVIHVESEGYMEALNERLRAHPSPDPEVRVEYHLKEGAPADEILRLAEETRADLIVLGTHGRTGLGRLLAGSVAEAILRRARCPVVAVKLPLT